MFERVAAANGIRQAGIDAAEDMVTTAVAQHADAIIGAWANSLKPDTAALAEAAEKITIADLAAADVPTSAGASWSPCGPKPAPPSNASRSPSKVGAS